MTIEIYKNKRFLECNAGEEPSLASMIRAGSIQANSMEEAYEVAQNRDSKSWHSDEKASTDVQAFEDDEKQHFDRSLVPGDAFRVDGVWYYINHKGGADCSIENIEFKQVDFPVPSDSIFFNDI